MSLENYRRSDFYITLSRTNTMLRDECPNLDELVRKEDLDRDDFIAYFREHGYNYDEQTNSFKED
ncbi:MAG: DUF4250 domain-containing protein [Succinivibrionaceae bacterium]|nr:DUF4250 domain-containing protein [Succinivibrionaceae bacterium]